MSDITVAALYKFTPFEDLPAIQGPLRAVCDASGVRGSLLIAHEGLNGTIAGSRRGIDVVLQHLRALPGCADVEVKESFAAEMPFARMKVRLKKEIVTLGVPSVDPTAHVGTYVEPKDWNALIRGNDVAVIDTRNSYEVGIGTFRGAVDPQTETFREFPAWWEANRERYAGRKVAMFCTGGIRCEKASNYLLTQGVDEVFHLRGGILKYLEDVPEEESLWDGQCYVFDGRVSVGHGLVPGEYGLCHACGRPVSDDDRAAETWEEGVSCPACVDEYDEAAKERFRERQRQIALAAARGERHLAG